MPAFTRRMASKYRDARNVPGGLRGSIATSRGLESRRQVDLSATEHRLLVFFARRPDRVVSPAEIFTHVWGSEYANELGYVKSYVRLVRRKIEENPRMPRYLVSRRGLGYTLVSHPGPDS